MPTLSRKFWIVPPLAVGILALVVAPMLKSGPKKAELQERAVKVRTMSVELMDVVPRAVGYGAVKPGRVWNAVAEVAGPVVWVSENLENGALVRAGEEILRIDESNYRLALAQIEAQISASDIEDKTTAMSLAIAERDFKLLKDDYARKKSLAAKGAVSKSALETAERQMLGGESQVQNLKNALAVNAANREVLVSQRGLAQLDLSHTLIKAPFDARITTVNAELAQYASKGQSLFLADGTDMAEIEAQFVIGSLRPLIAGRAVRMEQGGSAVSPAQGALGLSAWISLNTATHKGSWPAKVSRVSGTVDAQTQSVGIVASVTDPYAKAQPGQRPPLMRGTFVEVELQGPSTPNQIVVPAQAIREGKVYVLGADNRLVIQPVQVAYTQGGFSVVSKGLEVGRQLVLSDLVPAIEGMLLKPAEDKKAKAKLILETSGRKAVSSTSSNQ